MTDQEKDLLRRELLRRLLSLYHGVRFELRDLIIRTASSPDAEDEGDDALEDELESIRASFSERDRRLAHDLEDALARMDEPGFDVCIDCGRQIPVERLRAVPATRRCAEDQARDEAPETHPTM